jgi:hypothetical protein
MGLAEKIGRLVEREGMPGLTIPPSLLTREDEAIE